VAIQELELALDKAVFSAWNAVIWAPRNQACHSAVTSAKISRAGKLAANLDASH